MISAREGMSQSQLIDAIRETRITGTDVQPYAEAAISIEEMGFDEFRPAQFYVLRQNIQTQIGLRAALLESDLDPLKLRGSLMLNVGGPDEVGLTPPIVENDRKNGPALLDGTHRAYVGRMLNYKVINVVFVDGIHPDYPMNAEANEWSEMNEYDVVPSDPTHKKIYRPGDPARLYRDFSALNGSRGRAAGDAA